MTGLSNVEPELVVWIFGGVILADEDRSTCRETCPGATFFTISLIGMGLLSSGDIRSACPTLTRLSHDTSAQLSLEICIVLRYNRAIWLLHLHILAIHCNIVGGLWEGLSCNLTDYI